MPYCDKMFVREDNYRAHAARHTHYQEIFACGPEDGYKGVHVENPLVRNPGLTNTKPYAAIPFPPLELDLWRVYETKRRQGEDIPRTTPCDKYFMEHPVEADAALSRAPEWEYHIPEPSPREFQFINSHCLKGKFRLQINSSSNEHNDVNDDDEDDDDDDESGLFS